MKKISFEIKEPEMVSFVYDSKKGDIKVEVRNKFTLSEMASFIDLYVREFFGVGVEEEQVFAYNYLNAEFNLMTRTYDYMTNIDTSKCSIDLLSDEALWEKVTKLISNYSLFREMLDGVVEDVKEQIKLENSLGTVISNLVNQATNLMKDVSEMSPEAIDDATNKARALLKDIEESSVLGAFKKELK